jgi:hypothetical protein
MNKIALVTDNAFYWKFIETCFARINANVVVFPENTSDEDIAETGPGLLVMGFDRIAPLGSPLRRVKTIVIGNGDLEIPEQTRSSREKLCFLRWPVKKQQLLQEAADMLGISPRKAFRAVVRILSPDSEIGVIGTSVDFSSTGMSFAADRYYSIGHEVAISLSIPGDGTRLDLPGRVARSWTNESDGTSEYGVQFKPLDPSTERALKAFVLS